MKNYFSFNLNPKKLLPVWLLFLVFAILPYGVFLSQARHCRNDGPSTAIILLMVVIVLIVSIIFSFYVTKLSIESLIHREKKMEFRGKIGNFISRILLGLFLSVITLTIYIAWYMKDITRFFVNNSYYGSSGFIFQGKGRRLFAIMLLTLYIPFFLIFFLFGFYTYKTGYSQQTLVMILQVVVLFLMIPFMYLVYKWRVDIDYDGYHIAWVTNFWESVGKIAIEMVLTVITGGIYGPMAGLRLYKYFSERTVAAGNERKYRFGYDADQLNDFLFVWGQILLTIITLGIYYPWSFTRIVSRIIGKTYMELIQE